MNFLLAVLFATNCWAQAPDHRPEFRKKSAVIGRKKITVEIADTPEKRAHGLMFVKKLSKDQGMLFVFDSPEIQSFWMKNTLIPLSIGYFDEKKRLIEVLEMQPESLVSRELATYPSSAPAKYALEMNKGWFKENNIKAGAEIKVSN